LRISFAGGGTDLPGYYERHGGLVVSTAIDRYVYATIEVHNDAEVQIKSSDYRTFYQHEGGRPLNWQGELALPKAIVHHFGIVRGVKLFLASEVPPGTGLGSSSALTVALVKGLATLLGRRLTASDVASTACFIELDKLAMPIGRQDQYASAFGGLNAITFEPSGVQVESVAASAGAIRELESRLLLFFTHSSHNSSDILASQSAQSSSSGGQVVESLHAIKQLAHEARRALESGDVDALGDLLHASWQRKKQLAAGVTNEQIDDCYAAAREAGALGGKITGAGGGGFLMLLAKHGCQGAIVQALQERGLYNMEFRFEASGAQILMNSGLDIGPELLSAA
jgi:D-glycero-alpha-D-manno-heptose-7-phosphate kinase